jgi:hypothetical protein
MENLLFVVVVLKAQVQFPSDFKLYFGHVLFEVLL